MKKIFLFIGVFLSIEFIQSCQNCDLVDVPYTEQEAYIEMETQDIKLTYSIEDDNVYYSRIDGTILFGDNPQLKVHCIVTNTSENGGEFEFYATLSSQGDKVDFSQKRYIGAGDTYDFEITKEINSYTFQANVEVDDWGIIAPTVSVEKEVTKYRDVTN